MGDGITSTSMPQERQHVYSKVYLQANGGSITNAANDRYLDAGVSVGGELGNDALYGKAEVGVGAALTAGAEIGYNFDIGHNMGLRLSAKAQASKSLLNKIEQVADETEHASGDFNGTPYEATSNVSVYQGWKPSDVRVGSRAEFTFGSKNAKFGVGAEGGVRWAYSLNSKGEYSHKFTHTITDGNQFAEVTLNPTAKWDVNRDKRQAYAASTLSADVYLGKGVSFVADGKYIITDKQPEYKVGIRYTF